MQLAVNAPSRVNYAPQHSLPKPNLRDRVVPVRTAKGSEHYLTLLCKTMLWQQAVRHVSSMCSASEFTVFTQIFDRSIGRGFTECAATAIGIAEGDSRGNGCGLSERTVKRCIASLHEKGILTRQGVRNRGTTFTITLEWNEGKPMLATPKRLQSGKPEGAKMALIATPKRAKLAQEQTETPSLTSFVQESTTEDRPSDDAPEVRAEEKVEDVRKERRDFRPDDLNALIERTAAKTDALKAKRVEREKQRGNASAFETIWTSAAQTHYPEIVMHPTWTIVQKGIIKGIAQRWTSNNKLIEFSEFLEWCVVNWPAVIRQQFKWMTKVKPPMVPDFRFWSKHHEGFLECYTSGKLSKWMRAADRTRLEFLKARGKTHEEALYELAKEQAIQATKDEVNQKLAAVKTVEKRTAEAAKRLEKMQAFGAAPVHPKSEAAQKLAGVQPVAPIQYDQNVNLDELDASDIPAWEE